MLTVKTRLGSLGILSGDARALLQALPAESVQTCVTSPPYYGLRDYGVTGQIGMEASPADYVAGLVGVFSDVRRVLRDDGTLWLNLGDSYANGGRATRDHDRKQPARHTDTRPIDPAGIKPKDLLGIPWRVAFALQADGWYLRSDIIWHKPNPMPESIKDRPTSAHEHVFLFAKSERYFYDADAIREEYSPTSKARYNYAFKSDIPSAQATKNPSLGAGVIEQNPLGRNSRNVWSIPTRAFHGAHFATMPVDLAERCISAGSRVGDTVLDPFGGAGTTALAALRNGRDAILTELKPEYAAIAEQRLRDARREIDGRDAAFLEFALA